MMKEILLLGIGFFAFMTVYNLIVAIKRKEGFTPTIVAFLMTLATLFIFFEQVLYGVLCFCTMVIVAVAKHSEALNIREEEISKELEKNQQQRAACKTQGFSYMEGVGYNNYETRGEKGGNVLCFICGNWYNSNMDVFLDTFSRGCASQSQLVSDVYCNILCILLL